MCDVPHFQVELRSFKFRVPTPRRRDVDKQISLYYCKARYGHYGLFAIYPLRIAVLKADQYDFTVNSNILCESYFFANYFNGLTYEDKDYFSVEEIRFLFQLSAPCQPLSDNQLNSDLKEVATDIKRGKNMLKSDARIISKVIQYWESRHNEKFGEWFQEFSVADKDWWERRATRGALTESKVMIEYGFSFQYEQALSALLMCHSSYSLFTLVSSQCK